MAEAHGPFVEVHDRGAGARLETVDVQRRSGDNASRVQHLAHPLAVVERSDQQEQTALLRQIGHPRGERLLKPVAERHQAGQGCPPP